MTPISVDISEVEFVGSGMRRAECVLATGDGCIYASHDGGGVIKLMPDGTKSMVGGAAPLPNFRPNGFALRDDGSVLIANIADPGGIWKAGEGRGMEPFLLEVDGVSLRAANFVLIDDRGRTWITISSRATPSDQAYSPHIREGFVVLLDEKGARIVADGIGFANECRVGNNGRYLYVSETFGRRILRFPITESGLGEREVFASFGKGTYPDGCTFDAEGGLWVASVVSNRLIRVGVDGGAETVLEDFDSDVVDEIEVAYLNGTLTGDLIRKAKGKVLSHISSIAFGGPDLRRIYLGSLGGDRIPTLVVPVAGAKPRHWNIG